MKQVLIIVHLPRASPRVVGLVKYLPEFNWQPIILTGATSKYKDLPARIVETPYQDALGSLGRLFKLNPEQDVRQQIKNRFRITSKKSPIDFFITLGGEIINYPCPDKNWKPFAVKAGSELLQEENIDAIISISPSITSHLIAKELKAKYKIPWLADFRDLWSQNHNYMYSPLRKMLDRRLELKTLSKADALVTISEPWAEKLRTLHKGKSVYTVTHGFDPAEVNNPPAKLTAKFTITYTGSIYNRRHDPSKLLAALRDLVSDKVIDPNEVEVRFYGSKCEWLDEEIEEYGLVNVARQYGLVSRETAVEKQRESQLLLKLQWEDSQERGAYSGKIFEYLGARRPILATGGFDGDVVQELLNETNAGMCHLTVEDIKHTLKALYQEYKLDGRIAYKGEEAKVTKYTHREMARRFSEILNHLIGRVR